MTGIYLRLLIEDFFFLICFVFHHFLFHLVKIVPFSFPLCGIYTCSCEHDWETASTRHTEREKVTVRGGKGETYEEGAKSHLVSAAAESFGFSGWWKEQEQPGSPTVKGTSTARWNGFFKTHWSRITANYFPSHRKKELIKDISVYFKRTMALQSVRLQRGCTQPGMICTIQMRSGKCV